MIRELAIIIALGTAGIVLSGVDSYAQTTDQTDKSEEDWRKSKKKRNSSDIFKDILNKNGFGQGTNQYPQNPIDILPEESRRHLMKERAKVIALSEPGKEADAPYTPSEAAKTDPELAEQEKEAWTVIMTDLKGGNAQGSGGTGKNKIAIAGQGGSQSGSNGQKGSAPLRGGSSQSVADILAQIKGIKSGGAGGVGSVPAQQGSYGQGPLGQGSNNQGSSGQGSGGQMPSRAGGAQQGSQQGSQGQSTSAQNGETGQQSSAQGDSGQGQSTSAGQSQNASQDAGQSQNTQTSAQNSSDAASSENSQSSNSAQNDTQTADASQDAAKAKTAPEPIGPLERIKREQEANSSGSHTSAADYLQKSKAED